MRKIACLLVVSLVSLLAANVVMAQNASISGNVRNSATQEKLSAVSVAVKGTGSGTFTDDKGNFSIQVKKLPVTLVFSSIGFELQEVEVTNAGEQVKISLKPANALGQEIVVSASRVPERILESPVSVERVNAASIRNAPASNFYDVVSNLKGVDITTSSLTFRTPTTRGFNSSGNTRFNQLVDGMDNQAPGLNFSVGAIIGLSELDVDNLELLSGASSALYGPGGMNGTLLMSSKSPFKYQGLSFQVKEGVMHTDKRQRDPSAYHNWNLRWAKAFKNKFAFKMNLELIQAKDWLGFDYRNYSRAATGGKVVGGDRQTDPNYDGVNVYGDETTVEIRSAVLNTIAQQAPFLKPFIDTLNGGAAINVSRTGYTEKEVVNPNTINYKMSGSLHYKINDRTEAVLAGYWGTGNTIYTGSERYSIKDFKMGQYKLEINNKNWMFRAYTTQENAGQSYNLTVATRLFNESWKPSGGATGWYANYAQTYLGARLQGMTDSMAAAVARASSDVGRPLASSEQFRKSFDSVRLKPISQGGALLVDKTDLYSAEANYNLSQYTSKVADIIVGANFRRFVLNSEGTLFADKPDSAIGINEYGVFAQATRKLMDRLKLTVSGRYDKNQNFAGRFTPRATAVFKVADNNNIRLSYQTAYRFPSTQQQFINLDVGSNVKLIGGNDYFWNFYNFTNNQLYDFESLRAGQIVPFQLKQLKPETNSTFEIGYKGLLKKDKILVDVYGYFGQYQDFLGRQVTVQSKTGSIALSDTINGLRFSIPVNSTDKVKTYGFGASVDWKLVRNFTVGANVASDVLTDVPDNFVAYFNAPKYKANISVGNTGFGYQNRLGFSVMYRWQQALLYQGDFATGNLPDVQTVDAQVSFKLPKTKSILKVGATNLLNQYYYNAIGNSQVGGLYYISFGYNVY
jgi:outer membrane receptor protein involved in Fe transport